MPKKNKASIAYLAYQNKLIVDRLIKAEALIQELGTKVKAAEEEIVVLNGKTDKNAVDINMNTDMVSNNMQ